VSGAPGARGGVEWKNDRVDEQRRQPAERSRDRDRSGRARSARPRDGLGRPLPYGAPGVERQPEGVVRSPQDTLAEAQRLLDAGKPFHAHEVFEDAWKSGPESERELWRGLAQLAVGVTHAARGNQAGATALLGRATATLTAYQEDHPHGINIAALTTWADDLAAHPSTTPPTPPRITTP
jgi:hypothetical protein